MKTVLFGLLFCLISTSIWAQTPDSVYRPILGKHNIWQMSSCNKYVYFNESGCGYDDEGFYFETNSDEQTLINDTLYYRLFYFERHRSLPNQTVNFRQYGYLKEDSAARKVWYRPILNPDTVFLILDYSVTKGYRFLCNVCNEYGCGISVPASGSCKLDTAYYSTKFGGNRFKLFFSENDPFTPGSLLIEGVGRSQGLFYDYWWEQTYEPYLVKFTKDDSVIYELKKLPLLSVPELKNSLTVSPNPTVDWIEISGEKISEIKTIKIVSIRGEVCKTINHSPNDSKIIASLSGLPAGMYHLVMESAAGTVTKLVVKQ